MKIDKSFINNIPDDYDSSTIIETIIVMSEKMGLSVIAEGLKLLNKLSFYNNTIAMKYKVIIVINLCHSLNLNVLIVKKKENVQKFHGQHSNNKIVETPWSIKNDSSNNRPSL